MHILEICDDVLIHLVGGFTDNAYLLSTSHPRIVDLVLDEPRQEYKSDEDRVHKLCLLAVNTDNSGLLEYIHLRYSHSSLWYYQHRGPWETKFAIRNAVWCGALRCLKYITGAFFSCFICSSVLTSCFEQCMIFGRVNVNRIISTATLLLKMATLKF